MENPSRLKAWMYFHRKKLQLQVSELLWPTRYDLPWFDFQVKVKNSDGQEFSGRGIALEKDIAFDKACGEAIERMIVCWARENKKVLNDCGWAVHPNPEVAKEKAICEAIERDSFFCHFLTQTPFFKINDGMMVCEFFPAKAKKHFDDRKVKISAFEMHAAAGRRAVIVVADGHRAQSQFGLVLGLGCDRNVEIALRSATMECVRNVAAVLDGQMNVDEKVDAGSVFATPMDHILWALTEQCRNHMQPWFADNESTANSRQINNSNPDCSDLKLVQLVELPSLLECLPLSAFVACSSRLQRNFFDWNHERESEFVNDFRLSEFVQFHANKEWDRIKPAFPHPLG